MRGRKKTDEMRQAILACASEVFSQREFHEVLTDEIALKLGIGKGTLYRYFGSKDELYFAAIVSGLDGMHAALIKVLEEPGPLEQTIERAVSTVLEYFWHRRDFFILLYRMEPKLDPSERVAWQERRGEVIAHVAAALRQGMAAGGANPIDPRLAVELLLGMIRTVCLYRGPADTVAGLARMVTQVFLHGVLGTAGGGRAANRAGARSLRIVRGGSRTR